MRRALNLPPREFLESDYCITLYRDGVAHETGADDDEDVLCSWKVNQYGVGFERMRMLQAVLRILSARDSNTHDNNNNHVEHVTPHTQPTFMAD